VEETEEGKYVVAKFIFDSACQAPFPQFLVCISKHGSHLQLSKYRFLIK